MGLFRTDYRKIKNKKATSVSFIDAAFYAISSMGPYLFRRFCFFFFLGNLFLLVPFLLSFLLLRFLEFYSICSSYDIWNCVIFQCFLANTNSFFFLCTVTFSSFKYFETNALQFLVVRTSYSFIFFLLFFSLLFMALL